MRRIAWTAAIVLCFTLILSACGKKDAESVVKELDKFISSMESYQGSGTMTLHTGQQPQTYQVEVSYQKPQNYRIKLTNEEKNVTQIVLRNDDGVFVLTPKLNKVFRFQSDWPQNQGQVYLYQTLVQSILVDGSRQFEAGDKEYVFDVMANYNNGSFSRQKIWLNKSDLKPLKVEVSDTNANVLVDVKFASFDFNTNFDKSVFETDANMRVDSSNQAGDTPTMMTPEQITEHEPADSEENGAEEMDPHEDSMTDDEKTEEQRGEKTGTEAESKGNEKGNVKGAEEKGAENKGSEKGSEGKGKPTASANEVITEQGFIAMGPSYIPTGVMFKDSVDIVFGGNAGMMTKYEGVYNYTLIQTQPKDVAASLVPGIMLDLGFTIGELTAGDTLQTLTWTYEGQQFRLSSADLPESEMIKVAQSVQGMMGK
ncbi:MULTISPECIES: DUF4367 domain-containing protein [unclassified Paenibacillus]|uniref:DUF4367 domain-containing protein n=1 Tax=unclassified Paenibacillus TaxID=185978 RepID=UPI002F3E4C3C